MLSADAGRGVTHRPAELPPAPEAGPDSSPEVLLEDMWCYLALRSTSFGVGVDQLLRDMLQVFDRDLQHFVLAGADS